MLETIATKGTRLVLLESFYGCVRRSILTTLPSKLLSISRETLAEEYEFKLGALA